MKRDFSHWDKFLDGLLADIYPQPQDSGHTQWAKEVLFKWLPNLIPGSAIDVGCGEAFCQPFFEIFGWKYLGICLGKDLEEAKRYERNVDGVDFNFTPYPDNSFDLVFSRHSLEHSIAPILALMEWRRISKTWLMLVVPTPEGFGWAGRNHYSVMAKEQLEFLLLRAGWKVDAQDMTEPKEYRYLCAKI